MKKLPLLPSFLSSLLLCLALAVQAQDGPRPWTFWYWMYGAVSEEGIRADLQAMKDAGLGGCYLMPIRGVEQRPEYGGTAQQLSPRFWEMVDLAMRVSDSLRLGMGIHVCDGFALAGGPWIEPQEAMQKVVFADTIVGGGHHRFAMKRPPHYEDFYRDIAVYAVPVAGEPAPVPADTLLSPGITINDKGVLCADSACSILLDFGRPTLVRSMEIEPSGTNIQCQRLAVWASNNGTDFRLVRQLAPPRQGWQTTGYSFTYSLPPTTARWLRLTWTPEGTEPGSEDLDAAKWKPVLRLKSIVWRGYPQTDGWEGKAAYVWRIAPDTPDAHIADAVAVADIVTTAVTSGDVIDLTLPPGQWRILRMGHTATGHTNATAGGARGLECDKFSPAAVRKQVAHWFGAFMERPYSRVIKYMHVDSWECGSQNWSDSFAREFRQRRGYDLLPLLPVYAGVPLTGADNILRDVRLTINELLQENFFRTVQAMAREYGVSLSAESVAPTMVSDGMEHYRYADLPMGEFWLRSPTHDKPNDMLDAISGAHVYGKPVVQAEGFTEVRGVWDETPTSIKPLLDRNFALGMNRLFFHVFTHNPWTDRRPGMTLDGIGLFFQRDQTWMPEARGLVDYVTRCQRLLQWGRPVTDIAVFTGDEMPRRAFTPDRLVPMLPGLFGAERVEAERRRLANVGQPMEESPVGVRHSAGIPDLKDWVNALNGYHYDSMNPDALLHEAFNYRALVVPQTVSVADASRERIEALRSQGVAVIDQPYTDSVLPGLQPDAVLPSNVAFCHRTDGTAHLYFLANQRDSAVTFRPELRHAAEEMWVYDPLADRSTRFTGTMTLHAGGSLFVSTWPVGTPEKPLPADTLALPQGPWSLSFQENGLSLTTDTLFDWSTHPCDSVHFYSGHATYTTTFKYRHAALRHSKAKRRVVLQLGEVHDIAHVWVNGSDCGIVWTAPFVADISGAVKKGRNTLRIEIVNTWHNALRGADSGRPPYEGIWTNATYRTKGSALLPAGLF